MDQKVLFSCKLPKMLLIKTMIKFWDVWDEILSFWSEDLMGPIIFYSSLHAQSAIMKFVFSPLPPSFPHVPFIEAHCFFSFFLSLFLLLSHRLFFLVTISVFEASILVTWGVGTSLTQIFNLGVNCHSARGFTHNRVVELYLAEHMYETTNTRH